MWRVTLDGTVATVERGSAGRTTAAAAGRGVAAALAGAADEQEALRWVLQLVADAEAVDAETLALMLAEEPEPTGSARFDALLGGVVAHLARSARIPAPPWVNGPDRFLDEWWFVSGVASLHASALVQSPAELAIRGVFVCDGALDRV